MRDPINRLLGVMCYPFGGIEYYNKDYVELYYKDFFDDNEENQRKVEDSRKRAYDNILNGIQKYTTIHSYDEIKLLFDKYYLNKVYEIQAYQQNSAHKLYSQIISKLAKAFISQRDGKIVYKYWESEGDEILLGGFSDGDKILLFHGLTRRIALDLVVIQYLLDNHNVEIQHLNQYYGQVDMADLQLENILQRGVSENHLHLGTATNFYWLWNLMMENPAYYSPIKLKKIFMELQNSTTTHNVQQYILIAGILRVLMSMFVSRANTQERISFIKYCGTKQSTFYELIMKVWEGEEITSITSRDLENIDECIGYFIELWEQLLSNIGEFNEETDIIRAIFRDTQIVNTSSENVFLYMVMRYIEYNNNQDPTLEKVFWQYIRIKNMVFSLWVQDSRIRGLEYFDIFYQHNGTVLNLSEHYWKSVMRSQFQNKYLKRVEFRTTLNVSKDSCIEWISNFFRDYVDVIHEKYCRYDLEQRKYIPLKDFPQAGIVYHLIKKEDYKVENKCWLEYKNRKQANDERYLSSLRYKEIQEEYRKQVECLKQIRTQYPILSRYLVGLDAASNENNTPVWVFAPIYEKARDSQEEPLFAPNYNGEKYLPVQSLRFTFHAGEDFRHIISGLRRMDEVIDYCKFHSGDRIGHGAALGIDPEAWAQSNPMVVLPRIEILDNLLWVWGVFSEELHEASNVQFYLEREIYKHAKEIYKQTEGISIPILLEAYKKQFVSFDREFKCYEYVDDDDNFRRDKLFCQQVKQENTIVWNANKLLGARHCKKYLVQMEKPIYYKVTPQEVEMAKQVQKILKKKISKLGIVIEVNPSSNTCITEADTLFKNQAYTLNGLMNEEDNVMLCINTDNPSSCETNISNELAYIYYGKLASGSSKEDALQWINKLRRNGIDASFIKNNIPKERLLEELEEIVRIFE